MLQKKKMPNVNDYYHSDSDDYDEKNSDQYRNLFLEKTRKCDKFILKKNKKNIRKYFLSLELKFPPKIWETVFYKRYKNFLSLELESFISLEYKKFF